MYFQTAHVAGQPLHLVEAIVVQCSLQLPIGYPVFVVAQLAFLVWQGLGVPANPQVFVATRFLHVVGERVGQESPFADALIGSVVQVLLKAGADLVCYVGEDIVGPQQLGEALDQFRRGGAVYRCLSGIHVPVLCGG